MSGPFGDLYARKGGWPYPGTVPPISTLADIFTKQDKASDALRIGFTLWLQEKGTAEQNRVYNFYLVNPSGIDQIDPDVAAKIEEHFTDYFWATELPKYRVQNVTKDGHEASVNLDGQIELNVPVRYWSDDMRSYMVMTDPSTYLPAGDETPRLNYDRYYNDTSGNWETITSLDTPGGPTLVEEVMPSLQDVRYWDAKLENYAHFGEWTRYRPAEGAKPRLNYDRYYNEKSGNWEYIVDVDDQGHVTLAEQMVPRELRPKVMAPQETDALLALVPKLKGAVAYTAVRAKRRKELLADRPARKLMYEAVGSMGERGGKLVGEQHSMKGAPSLVAKAIEESMEASGAQPIIDEVEKMSDGVRYTLMVDKENYTAAVLNMIEYFDKQAWRCQKVANSWVKPLPSGYRGVNSKWFVKLDIDGTPAEEIVEVQFHTPESFHAKEDGTHSIKERIRPIDNQIKEHEKTIKAMRQDDPDRDAVTAKIVELKRQREPLEREQREFFEAMAKKDTPPDVDKIKPRP